MGDFLKNVFDLFILTASTLPYAVPNEVALAFTNMVGNTGG